LPLQQLWSTMAVRRLRVLSLSSHTMSNVSESKPTLLIYAEPLLAGSMTFIRTQAEALTSFRPYYISPHQLRKGLPLPAERVVAMRQGEGLGSRLSEIPFKLWGIAPLYVRRLKALKPALLHAQFGPAALRALPLARELKIPMIVTFQGYDATVYDDFARKSSHYSHRVYVRRRKVLESNSALIIAVSNFIRGELIRQGFAAENILTHYVGVDTALFCPDPAIQREDVVLFAGRLAEKKGCEYLIRAMAKVQSASPKAELVIIGDGPLRADLERLASESLQRYRFLGFQQPEVIKQWMNRARVFGAPSLRAHCGDAEGYPNERDSNVLSHYLQRLLDNPDLSSRMGAAAREYVCRQFNLRAQTKKLEEIYFQVLDGHVKPSLALSGDATSEVGVAALGS
jgi:colanic acid/amylovoran biosynthesis glycosyltransferase